MPSFDPMSVSLDLGSGAKPQNPYSAGKVYGVDIVDFGIENVLTADLVTTKIPFDEESFDYVTAFDFLEHVPRLIYLNGVRTSPFIELMNEIHRVLKPGGLFLGITPAFPNQEAFQDPTHVNIISEETIKYFAGNLAHLGEIYGFKGKFEIVDTYWEYDASSHLVWEMRAIK
jgi:SAM-dependent methyltransferase